jgi:hypothetical protein
MNVKKEINNIMAFISGAIIGIVIASLSMYRENITLELLAVIIIVVSLSIILMSIIACIWGALIMLKNVIMPYFKKKVEVR